MEVESQLEAMTKVEIKDMHKKIEEERLEEMWDDTQQIPFGTPTIAERAKFVAAVVEDTIQKALKYTKVDEEKEENAKNKEVI